MNFFSSCTPSNPRSCNPRLRTPQLAAAGCVAFVLVACSGEPSSADIDRAVHANAEEGVKQMGRLSGNASRFMPQVHGTKKLGCKPDTGTAFTCDVELDMTPPGGSRGKVQVPMRFIKNDDGWTLTR